MWRLNFAANSSGENEWILAAYHEPYFCVSEPDDMAKLVYLRCISNNIMVLLLRTKQMIWEKALQVSVIYNLYKRNKNAFGLLVAVIVVEQFFTIKHLTYKTSYLYNALIRLL